ncbi:MAG TPA: serine/threonine-protein kinase, partial [Polyangiaceae bacterium]|nr:serine/threonine-protein kinase [Polyangiaceae bacterium]
TIEGRYVVEELIGGGNIGLVYRARHKVIGKTVAVKLLRPDFARDDEVSERFLVEAKAASGVDNPHVVDIGDFGALPDGTAYFVMEYLDGRPLSELIRDEAPLPLDRIAHIGKQIAAGVGAAHAKGIVHRDLKPDNLLLTRRGDEEDFVTVVDFGIAKVAGAANRLTVAGTLYGTPHYMSPEQGRGEEVDLRSDVYSLGVILYEMATGEVPFDAESPFAVVALHVNAEPVPPHVARPEAGVSPALSAIIVKCLAKSPGDRFGSMAELAAELERARRGRPGALDLPDVIAPASLPRPTVTPLPARRSRWPLVGAGAVALAAAAALSLRGRPARDAAALAPQAAAPSASAPPPAPAEPAAAASQDAAARRGPTTDVALVISPIDAHVYQQKVDLGTMPISVPVPAGETVEVEIRRDGFWAKKLKLDASQPKRVIRLIPHLNPNANAHVSRTSGEWDKGPSAPHGPEEGAAKAETSGRSSAKPAPDSGGPESAPVNPWEGDEGGRPTPPPPR